MQAVSPVDPVAGVLSSLPALPAVGGLEGVGVVEAAGPGSSLKAGDWVIPAPGAGCWTTHAVFDDAQLTPVPNNIPCEYAAVRKSSRVRSRMLTYPHVCSRMLTYAHVCSRLPKTMLANASCEHALVLPSLCPCPLTA
jgi:threonine dehydrogenase-like Zn-dependent dehydrogenase